MKKNRCINNEVRTVLREQLFKLTAVKCCRLSCKTKKTIKKSNLKNEEKKQLLYLSKFGDMYSEYISEYLDCELKYSINEINNLDPVVICVVKDDLMRVKMFLKHYRAIGVKNFIFLDDNSSDGTREFLYRNYDVSVFTANKGYTTIRRQVWINKIISIIGYNRWYIVVDSDELLDYPKSSSMDVMSLIELLTKKKIVAAKALLLDMFSKDSMFADSVVSEKQIVDVCNMFSKNYAFSKSYFDLSIRGGARALMAETLNSSSSPLVSKYPVFFAYPDLILINSHHLLPAKYNREIKASVVLRHYKFLPYDKEKYERRMKEGNFYNNSSEYKLYFTIEKNGKYREIAHKLSAYENFNSLIDLSVVTDLLE